MSKAKLIKKDSPLQEQMKEQLSRKRKVRRPQPKNKTAARSALEMTTEWLKARREEAPSAREAFAALFAKQDPQSA